MDMAVDSLVRLKCKACDFEWEQRRMPRRCANCRAYLAIVGVEILGKVRGKIEPKQIPEAKEPKLEVKESIPEPESKKPVIESKPKIEKKKPRQVAEFKLENQPSKLEVKAESFDCGKCGAKIIKGMKECPGCGVELNWDEIYD